MDTERLQELAKQYPEVLELLKDNFSLSVVIMRQQLEQFDSRLTGAEARFVKGMEVIEARLDVASRKFSKLQSEIEDLKHERHS